MTVKQLKAFLSHLPDNMDVFMAERKTVFKYGLVNSAEVKEIHFMEDEIAIKPMARAEAVILDEE